MSEPFSREPGPLRRVLGCFGSLLLLALGLLVGLLLPDAARRAVLDRLPAGLARTVPAPVPTTTPASSPRTPTALPTPTPLPTPEPTPTPPPRPLPDGPVTPDKTRTAARLFNGIQLRTAFETETGGLASFQRETPADYALDLKLQVKLPVAARTVAELAKSNPALPNVLPKLPALLEKAAVSKFYHGVYDLKTDILRRSLNRLDNIMPPDTFYDTETVLEINDPETKRKMLLIQTEMDVDADGSDADRLNVFDDANDIHFQPLTSYRWPRRNPAAGPSVYLAPLQARLTRLQSEPGANRRETQATIEDLRVTISQLQKNSALIGRMDPFIVLPGFMVNAKGHPFQPRLGDYAVIIAGNTVYPAIFGDVGPSHKFGEVSLRLAQAVDPTATANRSPVHDLKITYLVFPGTAETPFGPPDLPKIRARCEALLTEIGGLGPGTTLREWENLIPPAPTPTPVPTPTPSVTPTPTASPAALTPPVPAGTTASPTPTPTPKPSPGLVSGVLATPSPTPMNRLPSATPTPTPGR